jgi:hypothetical protein
MACITTHIHICSEKGESSRIGFYSIYRLDWLSDADTAMFCQTGGTALIIRIVFTIKAKSCLGFLALLPILMSFMIFYSAVSRFFIPINEDTLVSSI